MDEAEDVGPRFAGEYFPLRRCNAAVPEDQVVFTKVELDAPREVAVVSLGAVITSFAGDYWGGSMQFALYTDQRDGADHRPGQLIADTYSTFYYPQNDALTVPYRLDRTPRDPVVLEAGTYWVAAMSNVNGMGTANVGCLPGDEGTGLVTLIENPVHPYFPESIDSASPYLAPSGIRLNFFFVYE
jgi:hypothetical protein